MKSLFYMFVIDESIFYVYFDINQSFIDVVCESVDATPASLDAFNYHHYTIDSV